MLRHEKGLCSTEKHRPFESLLHLAVLKPAPDESHDDGADDGGHDAEQKNQGKVLLDEGNVPEEVARADDGNGPDHGSRSAEEFKAQVVHARRAGNQGRKRANDGNEARKKNGFAAVAHIEAVRMLELLGINPADAAVVDFVSQPFASAVSDGIPENGAGNDGEHDHPRTGRPRGRYGARYEEKRVSGQKGHDDEARFQEVDEEHRRIDEHAVVGRKRNEEVIGIREEFENQLENIHGGRVGSKTVGKGRRSVQNRAFHASANGFYHTDAALDAVGEFVKFPCCSPSARR